MGNFRIWIGICLIFFVLSGWHLKAGTILVKNAQEIKAQLSSIQAGDTLLMKNGFWKDQQILIKGTGTETAPIVLKAETAGKVWITGASNLRISGKYVIVDGLYFVNGYSPSGAVIEFRESSSRLAEHCRLTNSAIVDFNPSSKSTDYKWVSLYGKYNRVDHCYFAGKNHQGTTLVVWLATYANHHRIDHNHFGPRPELGQNGGETIRIGTSDWSMYDSYTTVEWNYFEQCDGEIEIISNKSCENTYRYNTFDQCRGTLTLRHGNRCYVYSNFFFGHHLDDAGGVRIIGEDHRVYNNYFQDLNGTGLRSALSIMNGVPNSPLNRYFQVKRAQVVFNTLVNCYEPLVIGAGADEERTLPPKDCLIANNTIYSSFNNPIVTFEDQPINMTWLGNIFFGPDPGFDTIPGIVFKDPLLQLAADGLYRPADSSPLLEAAVDTVDFVSVDMDGQSRTFPADVGADEKSSDPVLIYPLKKGDVGPDWYPPEPPPTPVIQVQAGRDSLLAAIQKADDGDIVELISDDGAVYSVSTPLEIDKNITIRGKEGLRQLPVIAPATEVDSLSALFFWSKAKRLNLQNLSIDGQNKVTYLFKNAINHGQLKTDSLSIEHSGPAVFWAAAGSMMDSLIFERTSFYHGAGRGIVAKEETEGSGLFNIQYLSLKNCTVWDFKQSFVDVYAGDDVPFTPGPNILVNHCTFYRVGEQGTSIINAREVDFTLIKNCLFAYGPATDPSIRIYGPTAKVDYCDFFNTTLPDLQRSATLGSRIWQLDPQFIDPEHGNFRLQAGSYFWGKADDGYPLGDLRWTGKVLAIEEKQGSNLAPAAYLLVKNFPNPFNGQTTIQIFAGQSGALKWTILDARGRALKRGTVLVKKGQTITWNWQANGQASGVYFLRVENGNLRQTRKLLLLR